MPADTSPTPGIYDNVLISTGRPHRRVRRLPAVHALGMARAVRGRPTARQRRVQPAEQYFARLVEAGYDFSFEIESESGFDPELYDLKLTPQERLARIDADGVAAELIIDGFGAITHDPELAHETTLAFNRWFTDTYLRAAARALQRSRRGQPHRRNRHGRRRDRARPRPRNRRHPPARQPGHRTSRAPALQPPNVRTDLAGARRAARCWRSSTPQSVGRSRCGRWTTASGPTRRWR